MRRQGDYSLVRSCRGRRREIFCLISKNLLQPLFQALLTPGFIDFPEDDFEARDFAFREVANRDIFEMYRDGHQLFHE